MTDITTCRVLACRQKTDKCLIKPVIHGPVGVTFPPGTASISYYVGRYDQLVLAKGEKGGKEGMEAYVRDTYFAVVKADGADQQWEADSDSTVRTHVKATTAFACSGYHAEPKGILFISPSVFRAVRKPCLKVESKAISSSPANPGAL